MDSRQRVMVVIVVAGALVLSIVLVPGFLGLGHQAASVDYVKITVLVDNNANGTLNSPWGLAMLVETTDLAILFDSGPSPFALENNSASLGIDLESTCDLAVASHQHPDHVDGLSYVSSIHNNLTLYTPYYGFTRYWMNGFFAIQVEDTVEVSSGIFIISMGFEQALVINVRSLGLVVLAGCSHPGVEDIVARAIEVTHVGSVHIVIGGFHLLQASQEDIGDAVDSLVGLGVQNIYPIHCSGEGVVSYLDSSYPANLGVASVGFQIVLDETVNN